MRNTYLIAIAATAFLLTGPAFAEDAMKPAADAMKPSVGAMKPAADAMKPAMDAMKPDAMKPDAMKPDAMKPAADAMHSGTMTTTKNGEVVAIMPDGKMGTSMMAGSKLNSTVGMSSALKECMMFVTDVHGKVHQVDTSSAEAKAECEAIAK